MHSKKCTSCGNDNDPLLTNCLFCKSPLPVIDLDSIPNEVLVMNAAEWVGKLKSGGYIVDVPTNNRLGLGGRRMVEKGEIQGNALKYLSLLDIRASTNINLVYTVQNLRKDYQSYEKKFSRRQKGLIALLAFVIIYFLAMYLLIKH